MALFRVRVRAQAQTLHSRNFFDPNPIPKQNLKWPLICPCCMQPISSSPQLDLSFSQFYDRFMGTVRKRVTWKVPYCKPCLDHIGTQKKAKEARYIGIAVLAVAAVFALLLVIDFLEGQPRQWAVERVIAFTAFLALVGSAMLLWSRSLGRKAPTMMGATCCNVSEAIVYEGYDRDDVTLHTFVFRSLVYAHAFASANGSHVEPIDEAKPPR